MTLFKLTNAQTGEPEWIHLQSISRFCGTPEGGVMVWFQVPGIGNACAYKEEAADIAAAMAHFPEVMVL